jgi:hypothetical protein
MSIKKIFDKLPQQVGKQYGLGSKRLFPYSLVEYGDNGWADANKYLPLEYDLVYVKLKEKILMGWRSMGKWIGLRFDNEPVYAWKRKIIEECL